RLSSMRLIGGGAAAPLVETSTPLPSSGSSSVAGRGGGTAATASLRSSSRGPARLGRLELMVQRLEGGAAPARGGPVLDRVELTERRDWFEKERDGRRWIELEQPSRRVKTRRRAQHPSAETARSRREVVRAGPPCPRGAERRRRRRARRRD